MPLEHVYVVRENLLRELYCDNVRVSLHEVADVFEPPPQAKKVGYIFIIGLRTAVTITSEMVEILDELARRRWALKMKKSVALGRIEHVPKAEFVFSSRIVHAVLELVGWDLLE